MNHQAILNIRRQQSKLWEVAIENVRRLLDAGEANNFYEFVSQQLEDVSESTRYVREHIEDHTQQEQFDALAMHLLTQFAAAGFCEALIRFSERQVAEKS